ncbi:MAG TPA: S8 family serine peptidase [Thermodesulfovibrionales bacterium]|nr:S8 family serine peptidase [Thermodesulfovibrionales bacterium]
MKNRVLYLFMVLLIASCGSDKTSGISSDVSKASVSPKATVQSILSNMEKGTYKQGELLVKFRSGVSSASSLRTSQALGAKTIKKYSVVPNLEHVKLPDGVSVRDAVAKYMSDPNVEYAEPNYIRCAAVESGDPFFLNRQQWALYNTGQFAGGTPGADIRAPLAWDITAGNIGANSVKIAILDSGIDYNHPDLVNNIWTNPNESCSDGIDHDSNGLVNDCRGWNFVDNNNNPLDDLGHGTHLAGIIGASPNNGVGMTGVMWHVQMIPLKIFNVNSVVTESCISAFASDEIAAIQYAIAHGAKVINASFRSEGFCQSEFNAISAANAAGVLFVAAAGNGGVDSMGINTDVDPQYPASYNLPNIISVAATDQNDRLASFSNFGLNSVHVAAPGVYIVSTVPYGGIAASFSSLCTGSGFAGYDFCSGTSMAAPHVSALAGLLFGYYPNLNLQQVRQTIFKYVDRENERPNLHTLTDKIQSRGRINAYRALASLLLPSNLVATALSTTQVSLSWTDNAIGETGYKVERKGPGDADFVLIAGLPAGSTSHTDSGLSASTTYSYRVRVTNLAPADSPHSNLASVTTPASNTPPPVEPLGGGGGGCSIGARQNTPTALADLGILLLPLLLMALTRRRK